MLLRQWLKLQIIKSVLLSAIYIIPFALCAQTNYIYYGDKGNIILDRLEIKTGNDQLRFSTLKPYARRSSVAVVESLDSLVQANDPSVAHLTPTDRYNMQRLLMNNAEWSKPRDFYKNRKPWFWSLYKTHANMVEVNNPDFFMAINPVFQLGLGKESGYGEKMFINTRGIAIRGMISKKIGFNLYATENQERDPLYVQAFERKFTAVPGVGFYKDFNGTGYDYFDARGSVTWNVARFIDMQFGYDKNSIGNGYRSLFLSDFSNSALFFKINTRIWKLNYQSLLTELYADHGRGGAELFNRKYARINHLSVNATKWLNVGLFESIVFGRPNHFDFQYMVPVMFLRPAEQQTGSGDNAMLGFDAKVNLKQRVQLYGQLLWDEFVLKEMTSSRGFWANKYGYQLGFKYIDAFGLKNVDLQVETNRVRPYTYAHYDTSVGSYTHYNQPLAHPLGANFQELIAIVRAQPMERLYLQAKVIHYFQGLDSAGLNFGSNPFLDYTTRPRDYDFKVGTGDRATCNFLEFSASYELLENLFVDLTALRRTYKVQSGFKQNSTIFNVGVRMNIARRAFDF
ncbi:capsule assembly Wzi family protein [Foetidibacter luteolus]|uniref:capsule assembly Wzi family protein n=1 Tax=Foetidibacter luteolus TaxID=2608880 RepID=UPI001F41D094|nr:capsule assembly Wzi family protein [Foetidibacter luteolus]